jgi:hypothetical protein
VSGLISIQAEPRYIQKGGKVDFGSGASAEAEFSYFELPFSVKAQFNTKVIKPYIFAGPTLSFLLSSETEFKLMGQKSTADRKDETDSKEFSIDIGAAIQPI